MMTNLQKREFIRAERIAGRVGLSYTIMINEEQRQIIARALEFHAPNDVNDEEAKILRVLIDELPELETADPMITHGLCL